MFDTKTAKGEVEMMGMQRIFGTLFLVPAIVLLTVSFFVLFTVRKVQERCLKIFGYVITGLLWVATAIILALLIHILTTVRHPMAMMHGSMDCLPKTSHMQHHPQNPTSK